MYMNTRNELFYTSDTFHAFFKSFIVITCVPYPDAHLPKGGRLI